MQDCDISALYFVILFVCKQKTLYLWFSVGHACVATTQINSPFDFLIKILVFIYLFIQFSNVHI